MNITQEEARFVYIWMMAMDPMNNEDLEFRDRITNFVELGYELRR